VVILFSIMLPSLSFYGVGVDTGKLELKFAKIRVELKGSYKRELLACRR
jgi:hypothetical protein